MCMSTLPESPITQYTRLTHEATRIFLQWCSAPDGSAVKRARRREYDRLDRQLKALKEKYADQLIT